MASSRGEWIDLVGYFGCTRPSRRQAQPEVWIEARALELELRLPCEHARARHVHFGSKEARSRQISRKRPECMGYAAQRFVRNVEAPSDAREESQASESDLFLLVRFAFASIELGAMHLELEQLDVVPLAFGDSLFEAREILVYSTLRLADERKDVA